MPPPTLSGRSRVLLNTMTAALVLRLLNLPENSLWVDEGVTWWNSTHGSWRDTVLAEANHPPVWWVVTRAWLSVFPGREAALRMPAVLLGVAAVWLAYLLARRLADPGRTPSRGHFAGSDAATAVWVAALAAANPFWIEYAQEARMYAALLVESLALSLLYLRWLDGGRRRTLVAYGAVAVVALYTQYFALWPILGHAAHALWAARATRSEERPVSALPLLVTQAVAGTLFLPWFAHMLGAYHGISPGEYEPLGRMAHALWRMGVGPALVALDRPRVEAGPLAVFREEPVTVVLTALAWAVPIALGVRAVRRDRGGRAFLLAGVGLPLALVLAACVRWPLVHEKYLVFLAPLLLYLAVLGARSAPRGVRPVLLGGLVALHAAGLLAYHAGDTAPVRRWLTGDHVYGKESWREAHRFVADERGPRDVVLLHAPFTHTVWDFYDADATAPGVPLPALDLPCDRALSPDEILARVPAIRDAGQVFLVLSHEATDVRDHYWNAVGEAARKAWGGMSRFEMTPFPRQWGIRVFRFAR